MSREVELTDAVNLHSVQGTSQACLTSERHAFIITAKIQQLVNQPVGGVNVADHTV
jgi:hypothetical protein